MKRNPFRVFLFALFVALVTTGAGCQSGSLNTHQQVGVTCETAASALDTLTAGKLAGKITSDQLNDAIRIYEGAVVPFCVPVAANLTEVQRVALAAAIVQLNARAGALR
jgi:hypothetical protein